MVSQSRWRPAAVEAKAQLHLMQMCLPVLRSQGRCRVFARYVVWSLNHQSTFLLLGFIATNHLLVQPTLTPSRARSTRPLRTGYAESFLHPSVAVVTGMASR
jgi:hypothetical protein